MATEVGKGFVEVVADLDKFGASVSKGMSGQQAAFSKSGTDAGKSFSTGVEKEIGGKQSIFSKFGAQQGAAFSGALSGALVGGVAAAGTAVAGFAVKAIGDFQSTAIAADRFRDTTGLALDQSSRWIAVADDVGVSAGTIEGAFKRMQVSIDKNREAFGDLIVTTASGSTDLTATFLNVVEHIQGIEDPIDRANEATKLFGRGFGEVSQIITTDADKLRQSLEDVSDAQIIDEEEVTKARAYEAAMDDLSDAFRDMSIAAGESLVPIVTALANLGTGVVAVADKVGGLETVISSLPVVGNVMQFASIFEEGASNVDRFGGAVGTAVPFLGNFIKGLDGSNESGKETADTFATVGDAANGFETRIASLGGRVDGAGEAMSHFGATADSVAQHLDKNVEGMLNLGASADAVAENVGNETDALLALNDALAANLSATLSSFDSTFALAESQRAFNDAAIEANTAVEDQAIAYEDATQEALKVADATVKYAEDQAALKGDTLSAKEATQIQIDTLGKLADQIGGPVADQIRTMIGQLQTLDQTNADPDATLNDQATQPIADVKGKIDGLDGARASVVANETGNALDRLRSIEGAISRINGMRLGISTSIPGLAAGITNFAGGLAVVGEEGPELVHLPAGTTVHSAEKTRASISAVQQISGDIGPRQHPIVIVNQGTFLGTEEAFGKLADRAIAQARRAGHRVAA